MIYQRSRGANPHIKIRKHSGGPGGFRPGPGQLIWGTPSPADGWLMPQAVRLQNEQLDGHRSTAAGGGHHIYLAEVGFLNFFKSFLKKSFFLTSLSTFLEVLATSALASSAFLATSSDLPLAVSVISSFLS